MFEDKIETRNYRICDKDYTFHAVKGDRGSWDGGGGPVGDWQHENGQLANIKRHVKQFRTVVQAGGCQGLYPYLLSELFEVVYTFEPYDLSFECLFLNSRGRNIIKYKAALGEVNGTIGLRVGSTDNLGMNSVSHDLNADQQVQMFCLDNFTFDNLDLLMLDTESYEDKIISGAKKTIIAHKPVIFAECGLHGELLFINELGYKEVGRASADVVYAVI
jgi:FkbM family methyltransferase